METKIPSEPPLIGIRHPNYSIAVIDERSVRVGAGLLLIVGVVFVSIAVIQGSGQLLRPFGMIFMADMLIRVGVGDKWSPILIVSRFIVRNRAPLWVGAAQKAYAWWLGIILSVLACSTMGVLKMPLWVTFSICSLCLLFLTLEALFGICPGCKLQALFSKNKPQYCPKNSCQTNSVENE